MFNNINWIFFDMGSTVRITKLKQKLGGTL